MVEDNKQEIAAGHGQTSATPHTDGFAGGLARKFIDSPLTPLLLIASFLIGLMGMMITPREEDPQISVPMVDIFVGYPGASAEQVKNLVSEPLERLMSEISGVKHVYSMSQDGRSMVTVRFDVGQQMEPSLVKLYDKLYSHMDVIPKGVTPPLVKPKGIDDVPVVTLTLSSKVDDIVTLRKMALDVQQKLKSLPNTGQSFITGGSPEQVRVEVDPGRLTAFAGGITLSQIARAIGAANQRTQAGDLIEGNRSFTVYSGEFLHDARQVGNLLIAVQENRPVMLRDLAIISQGESETKTIVTHSQRLDDGRFSSHPAVTIAIAKKRGTNGVEVARSVLDEVESLTGTLIPDSIQVNVTRDYGATADEKVSGLIFKLFIVTVIVTLLMMLSMGKQTAIIVAITIPVVLLMTLFFAYLLGFTINRVSMFALVFAIGILVDDAIVVVENIYRRWLEKKQTDVELTIKAVDEVGNPTVLATFTVVAALLPMAFVSDMMGPFMMPIPVLASAAMVFSLFAAFIFVPWLSMRIKPSMAQLDVAAKREHAQSQKIGKFYGSLIGPIMDNRLLGMLTLLTIIFLMLAAVSLFYFKAVAFKMLPMDNKSELNIVIDMPEGTDLFVTSNLAQRFSASLNSIPEIVSYQTYVGTASPFNFNGLVRHYFLRSQPWQADIAVQLLPKHDRERSSHEIAVQVREMLTPVARASGARLTVAEAPPGPPVLASMVAEVYGPSAESRRKFAADIMRIMQDTPDLEDINTFMIRPYPEIAFEVDRMHAAMHGVSVEDINREVTMAMGGFEVGPIKLVHELEQTTIVLQLPLAIRANPGNLLALPVRTAGGTTIPLGELGRFSQRQVSPTIFHKDLKAVEYVTADVIGPLGAPLYGMINVDSKLASYRAPDGSTVSGTYFGKPKDPDAFGFKWDGEWEVTYVTFRDMGLAFGVALVLIYMLVVAEFRNFMLPLVVMAPIPLTLIGIIPGHWMLGADFTATSMIGFIALAGIIVRNSILLVDFAKVKVEEGMSVRDAVVLAAEVRMRPIVITAMALVIGSTVLLTDPIFQGMAVSLLFGSIVATFLTLVVIPLGCFSAHKSFPCKDGGGECQPDSPPPDNNPPDNPQGGAPASGGDAASSAPVGRPPRLAKQGEPAMGVPETPAAPPSAAGRPPRLAKKTEIEQAMVPVAEAAPATVGGRPPRLEKRSEPATGAPETPAAPPPVAGRPPRLAKKTDMEQAMMPVAEAAPATVGGRPPRLEKRSDVLPAIAPATQASATGGRPARLEKRPVPQAIVETPATIALPVVKVKDKPAPVTPSVPAKKPETVKPAASKSKPAVAKAKAAIVTKPEPEFEAEENTPLAAAQPIVVSESARQPASSRKRKLRGIRIKIMDDGSDEK
ncbi:MAG TPA: efflux RND transporter permease subunit [Azonexus sp.]|nr:efflux RND transporter permease subunit [Azonexus sp.]